MKTPNPPTEFTIRHVITFEPSPAVRMSKPDPADPRDPSFPIPHVIRHPQLAALSAMEALAAMAPEQTDSRVYRAMAVVGREAFNGRYETAARWAVIFIIDSSIYTPTPRVRILYREVFGAELGTNPNGLEAKLTDARTGINAAINYFGKK